MLVMSQRTQNSNEIELEDRRLLPATEKEIHVEEG